MQRQAVILAGVLSIASFGHCAEIEKTRDKSPTTPERQAIEGQKAILGEILSLYATEALEPPKDLVACAREMFKMSPSGQCRDKFSYYLTPEEAKQITENFEGEFGGIGLELTMKDGDLTVIAPWPDTPAERAGLKQNDIIVKIDGEEPKNINEAISRIRGQIGAKVKLTVARDKVDKPLEFNLVRVKIIIHPVKWQISKFDKKVGVIKVNAFQAKTVEDFKKAVDDLKAKRINKIVIDLRNNPGGLLSATLGILVFFKGPNDTLLTIRTRDKATTMSTNSLEETTALLDLLNLDSLNVADIGSFRKLQAVVLINGGSASASEIFAGTMKDWGYPVIGEVSFGKGVGQIFKKLSDGSVLALTTFEFLVGNGKAQIRDKGVTPTIEIKESDSTHKDIQLKRAVKAVKAMPAKNL